MKLVKRIDVFSFAKFYAVFSAGLGVVVGLIYGVVSLLAVSFMGAVSNSLNGGDVPSPGFAAGFGVVGALVSIILMPILYAVIGFIGGALMALFWNLAVKFTGGFKVQIEEEMNSAPVTQVAGS